jgi:hypothetical protein
VDIGWARISKNSKRVLVFMLFAHEMSGENST